MFQPNSESHTLFWGSTPGRHDKAVSGLVEAAPSSPFTGSARDDASHVRHDTGTEVVKPDMLADGECAPGFAFVIDLSWAAQMSGDATTPSCELNEILFDEMVTGDASVQPTCSTGLPPVFQRQSYIADVEQGIDANPSSAKYWPCLAPPGGPLAGNNTGCELQFRQNCGPTPSLLPVDGNGGLTEFLLMSPTAPFLFQPSSAFDESETELVQLAGNFLQLNVDLVNWALCLIGVDPEIANCMALRVGNASPTIVKRSKSWTAFGVCRKSNWIADQTDGVLTLCMKNTQMKRMFRAWRCGNPNERLCALITMTTTLAHEQLHVCGWSRSGENFGQCDATYLLQNLLTWGLAQRYPSVSDASCCDHFFLWPDADNIGVGVSQGVDPTFFGADRVASNIAGGCNCQPGEVATVPAGPGGGGGGGSGPGTGAPTDPIGARPLAFGEFRAPLWWEENNPQRDSWGSPWP